MSHLIKSSHILKIVIVYRIFIPPSISLGATILLCIQISVQMIGTCKNIAAYKKMAAATAAAILLHELQTSAQLFTHITESALIRIRITSMSSI